MLGNIDPPAICQECAVLTTLDSVQQICWECWTRIAEEMESHHANCDNNPCDCPTNQGEEE